MRVTSFRQKLYFFDKSYIFFPPPHPFFLSVFSFFLCPHPGPTMLDGGGRERDNTGEEGSSRTSCLTSALTDACMRRRGNAKGPLAGARAPPACSHPAGQRQCEPPLPSPPSSVATSRYPPPPPSPHVACLEWAQKKHEKAERKQKRK